MELLAPAGSWDAFLAALANGADAVYLGGKSFSARQAAENFSEEEIIKASEHAHLREKKIYITVNTLIDNEEFGAVLDYIFFLYNTGVDGIIIQDLGLLDAIKTIFPHFRVHASTQMTVHNSPGVRFLQDKGIKRVVLAREMKLDELKIIRREAPDMELEVFVHGALCYSYSGQCLFSSMVGGRSGNRGRCAQPCRLPYKLYSRQSPRGKEISSTGKYLLSPSDLSLIDYLPELQKTGINSLKIEGRMKRPEYVATVTRAYREALDMLESGGEYQISENIKAQLLKIFNRNFTSACLFPGNNEILNFQRPNNRGVYIGRVLQQGKDFLTRIKLSSSVSLGDGLEIWVARGKGPAFVLREMTVDGQAAESAEKGEIIEVKLDGPAGSADRVFKTRDEELMSAAARSIQMSTERKIGIDVEAFLMKNEPLKLQCRDQEGNEAEVFTRTPARQADKHPLDTDTLRSKLDRLGNTPFEIKNFVLNTDNEELIIPFSEINEARRQASEELLGIRLQDYAWPVLDKKRFRDLKGKYMYSGKHKASRKKQIPLLSITVSGTEEARVALDSGADRVYFALEGIGKKPPLNSGQLSELICRAREAGSELIPLLPRIQKAGKEEETAKLLSESGAVSIMVANIGALKSGLDKHFSLRGDYSLNVFNFYSMRTLLNLGLQEMCLSPELNFSQLKNFEHLDKAELLIHGEIILILLISEHCILPYVLGRKDEKCLQHCRKNSYYLKDEKGYEFPVATDNNCRFYLFNSRTLCLIDDLEKIISLGPGSVRIEARRSSISQIRTMLKIYREALDKLGRGEKTDLTLYKEELAGIAASDFTKGHYYRGVL